MKHTIMFGFIVLAAVLVALAPVSAFAQGPIGQPAQPWLQYKPPIPYVPTSPLLEVGPDGVTLGFYPGNQECMGYLYLGGQGPCLRQPAKWFGDVASNLQQGSTKTPPILYWK